MRRNGSTAAIRFRFGAAGLLGAVTPDRVAVAASGGSAADTGLVVTTGLTLRNTNRP